MEEDVRQLKELVDRGEEVTFYSDAYAISSLIWIPDDYKEGEKRPAIVVARGLGATKEFVTPAFAKELNKEGYIVLGFDYRATGNSEGIPGRIVPFEQVEDLRSAITYLETRSEVDVEKIALFGDCEGGSNVVYTAALDPRVYCVMAVFCPGNYDRWIRTTWGYEEYRKLRDKIEEDKKKRVLTGEPTMVKASDFLRWGEDEKKDWKNMTEKYKDIVPIKGITGGSISLQSIEKHLEFNPEALVQKIAPRPIYFGTPEVSIVVPWEETESLYNKAKDPKELWIMPKSIVPSRYGAHKFGGGYIDPLTEAFVAWFKKWL